MRICFETLLFYLLLCLNNKDGSIDLEYFILNLFKPFFKPYLNQFLEIERKKKKKIKKKSESGVVTIQR